MSGNLPPNGKGRGRPAGSRNKVTVTAKEAIESAFVKLGGVKWLVQLGKDHPKSFANLYAKLIPIQTVVTQLPAPPQVTDPNVLDAALALEEAIDAQLYPHTDGTGSSSTSELPLGQVSPHDPSPPAEAGDQSTSTAVGCGLSPVNDPHPAAAR